jgi:hypothetical protein
MAQAKKAGLLKGDPADLSELFRGLLLGDVLVSLLLGVTNRPSAREIAQRAGNAASAFLQLSLNPRRVR